MPYDPMLVQPMRDDMTSMDAEELLDPSQVDAFMAREGTKLVFINSVCGCAAGQARPALRHALQHTTKPDHVGTVFAGQDLIHQGPSFLLIRNSTEELRISHFGEYSFVDQAWENAAFF